MGAGPTLAEVRALGQNNPHLLADPDYARLVMRRISPYITWAIVRYTPLSADSVTLVSILSGVLGGMLVLPGSPLSLALAVVFLQLGCLLDIVDGEVARSRRTASKRGTYLDLIGHIFQNMALYACSGVLLMRVTDNAWWATAIALLTMSFILPFGYYAALRVRGQGDGSGAHGGRRPAVGLRRLTLLWDYPASMNLFCVVLLVDAAAQAAGAIASPVIVAGFFALWGSALIARHFLHAIRLLDRTDWSA